MLSHSLNIIRDYLDNYWPPEEPFDPAGECGVLIHEISSCEPCYSWNIYHSWQLPAEVPPEAEESGAARAARAGSNSGGSQWSGILSKTRRGLDHPLAMDGKRSTLCMAARL